MPGRTRVISISTNTRTPNPVVGIDLEEWQGRRQEYEPGEQYPDRDRDRECQDEGEDNRVVVRPVAAVCVNKLPEARCHRGKNVNAAEPQPSHEKEKCPIVAVPDTPRDPWAMVVHLENTSE